ncbi:MAG: myo-inositol 2-dehydrogenase/D-chiro-inositol 1-dehydrogenase [Saprospiraceae bacterium]|jgi:myo-inositol 2-dehydrogenase/D-chiro-inositol 1-dehydrogenase
MVRAGIIGWGENGKKIANALHFQIKDTEVIGIATENPEGRDYAMNKMGLKHIFSNYSSLLELHQIDMICICSDGDLHLNHVEKSLTSGSNVFIDHPLASNVEDCRKMEKIIDSYPSYKSTVAFPRRFDHRLEPVQRDIVEGKLGNILRIDCHTYEAILQRPTEGEVPKVRKGIFMDLMLQDIDMVRWLTGAEYESVYVAGNAHKYPSLKRQNDADTAIAIAKLTGNVLVNFISSRVTHRGSGYELKVVGTNGEINISQLEKSDKLVDSLDGKPFYLSNGAKENDYLRILKDYVASVRNGNKIKYKLEDATEATRVAVAMTKSFLLGQEVSLKS